MTDKEEVIQQVLGEEVNLLDWRKRMREGFVITLKIKRWRARTKLSLSDLGIVPPNFEVQQAYEQLLSLGSKTLLPQQTLKDLDAIERGARLHLAQYTFQTPFGIFIPYTSYALWKSGNEAYKQRYYAKRDEIVAEYPSLIESLLTEYDLIANHSYQLLSSQFSDLAEAFPNERSFLEHFRNSVILPSIKTAQEFAESFIFDEQFRKIELLENLVESETVASDEIENVQTQREAEIAAAQKRRMMLEEMNRDLVRKTREQKQTMIDSFLASLISQLRTVTYDAVTSVLTSIKEQDTLQGRPVIQLQKLVRQLQNMNFYGDQDIDSILVTLHSIIEKPAKERNLEEITRQLRSIATLSRGTILALGDEAPREGRELSAPELGISLFPSDEEMREAREEITSIAASRVSYSEEIREEREEREEQRPVILVETLREERG